jgi:hypothetical protein
MGIEIWKMEKDFSPAFLPPAPAACSGPLPCHLLLPCCLPLF